LHHRAFFQQLLVRLNDLQLQVDELEAEVAELAERVAQLEAAKQARQ
jgi:hypothetical protein